MHIAALLFVLQLFATCALTGLIWFVQIVHYPLFTLIPNPHQSAYARSHQTRTGWVVAPLMLVELVTSLLMLWRPARPLFITTLDAEVSAAFVAVIWISTALVQVPLHRRLLQGIQESAVHRLVVTNWVRTAAWSLRSILLLLWLTRLL